MSTPEPGMPYTDPSGLDDITAAVIADRAEAPEDLAEQIAASAAMTATYASYVEHGSDADAVRPSGAGLVLWVGTVEPNNAEATDIVIAPASATVFDTNIRTAGDVAITTTSYADIDNGLDVTVDVAEGDVVAIYINTKWKGSEIADGRLTVWSVNQNANLGALNGVTAWQGPANFEVPVGSPFFYTVVASDISGGTATFRLRGKVVAAGTRSVKATTSDPLAFSAQVIPT